MVELRHRGREVRVDKDDVPGGSGVGSNGTIGAWLKPHPTLIFPDREGASLLYRKHGFRMTRSAQRTLLEAVRVLHLQGYESIRVHAYTYATGHWRCELGPVGSPVRNGPKQFTYSSASRWDYFRDDESKGELGAVGEAGPVSPDELARQMLDRAPGLAALRAPATAYVVWFSALLNYCGPDGTFMLSDDWDYNATTAGFVQLQYPTKESAQQSLGSAFPLAPAF